MTNASTSPQRTCTLKAQELIESLYLKKKKKKQRGQTAEHQVLRYDVSLSLFVKQRLTHKTRAVGEPTPGFRINYIYRKQLTTTVPGLQWLWASESRTGC